MSVDFVYSLLRGMVLPQTFLPVFFVYLRMIGLLLNCALKYCALSWTGSMLQNGVSDFETKSLTTHCIQNSQQPRNAAKSLSRPTTETQFSTMGIEDVPLSTNKKLSKSETHL